MASTLEECNSKKAQFLNLIGNNGKTAYNAIKKAGGEVLVGCACDEKATGVANASYSAGTCKIRVFYNKIRNPDFYAELFTHEVWHCFQMQGGATYTKCADRFDMELGAYAAGIIDTNPDLYTKDKDGFANTVWDRSIRSTKPFCPQGEIKKLESVTLSERKKRITKITKLKL